MLSNEHHWFLLDGLGALVSATALGLLLPAFPELIGVPPPPLYVLAGVAACFAVYSLSCFRVRPRRWPAFLRFIAVCNLLYCGVTVYHIFGVHGATVGGWGYAYFVGEVLLVVGLALLEWRAAGRGAQVP